MEKKTMVIGCDHAAYPLKEKVKSFLKTLGFALEDVGTHDEDSVDYPDYGMRVAASVSRGEFPRGILLCGTGLGMSMVANRFQGVRAALCNDLFSAIMSRRHNDANVLVMGGRVVGETLAVEIVRAFLETPFEGGRHGGRIKKFDRMDCALETVDPEIAAVIGRELTRQRDTIELIASENIISPAVMAAQGSVLTNKYAEGYPEKRYYGGCEHVDAAEKLAIARARELFRAAYANVQPHSGSQANMAVYFALLKPGDTVLGMNLSHGGHLTHGSPVSFSGQLFRFFHYGVREDTGIIDYPELARTAEEHRPKMIVAGASAYPRIIDFRKLSEIARSVGAYLMVDMAHIAGLVAAGVHPSPIPFADVVTSTTHKTLRGPRGGLILAKTDFGDKLNKSIFPGIQGGPLMHVIAAKAVAFKEALSEPFRNYQAQIVKNARALAETLVQEQIPLVSGGTDNHMMLVDLRSLKITGKEAEAVLGRAGLTVNKNSIPYDPMGPNVTSGIRIGTPAVTSRGMKEPEMTIIAEMIASVIKSPDDQSAIDRIRERSLRLCRDFPIYSELG